jgi:cell division protein FtsZ
LSEVNEASTIIQNAAHEDANIIFGAVQDESMGDEVKITVIATGFKQQEMPQRRERMLAEATLPTMRYDVPIQPRVVTPRPATMRFASEMEAEPVKEVALPLREANEVKEPIAKMESDAPVELVPVPASVFDDDFFRAPGVRREKAAEAERAREATHFSAPVRVQQEGIRSVTDDVGDSSVRVPAFGSAAVAAAEPDELDIPAFLRRGN